MTSSALSHTFMSQFHTVEKAISPAADDVSSEEDREEDCDPIARDFIESPPFKHSGTISSARTNEEQQVTTQEGEPIIADDLFSPFRNNHEFELADLITRHGCSRELTKDIIRLIENPSFCPRSATERLHSKSDIMDEIRSSKDYKEHVCIYNNYERRNGSTRNVSLETTKCN
jgi:hypothetical protein